MIRSALEGTRPFLMTELFRMCENLWGDHKTRAQGALRKAERPWLMTSRNTETSLITIRRNKVYENQLFLRTSAYGQDPSPKCTMISAQ